MGRMGDTRISQNSSTGRSRETLSAGAQRKTFALEICVQEQERWSVGSFLRPMPVKAKARLVIQGQHCLDNAQGLVKTDAPTVHRTAVSVILPVVASMGWCRSLGGVDVSCAFIQEPLFSEPPARGLPGVEKGSLIEVVKGVFGLPDSPRGWWKELRDTLQEDSWLSLILDPAFFHLLDFSGHLIGMIIVHVDDLLLETNDSHQAKSHISRSSENTISPIARGPTAMQGSCTVGNEFGLFLTT